MKAEVTVKELARRKRVSLKAIYDQLAVGRIRGARKVGRVWRISLAPATGAGIREANTDLARTDSKSKL